MIDPYYKDAVTTLQSANEFESILWEDPRRDNWHSDAEGLLVRSDTYIKDADFEKAKHLKVIVKQGIGVDNIDLESAKKHGVIVCNTPKLNSEAVAELSICLALSISRRVCEFDRRIRGGEWINRNENLGRSLFQKTIGIIGMGNIGESIAKKWIGAMEGKIVAYDPFAPEGWWKNFEYTRVNSLDELLPISDVVTIHAPLTKSTKNMISGPQLKKMKPDAILLNCARKGIVDEDALLEALKNGTIYGAGLDCMNVEPPTMKAYGDGLLSLHNVIMMPHMAGATVENQITSGIAAVETCLGVLQGKEVVGRLV